MLETESCLVRLRELNTDLVSQLSVVSEVINAVTVGINHLPPPVGIDNGWIQECRSTAKVWITDYFLSSGFRNFYWENKYFGEVHIELCM